MTLIVIKRVAVAVHDGGEDVRIAVHINHQIMFPIGRRHIRGAHETAEAAHLAEIGGKGTRPAAAPVHSFP